MDDHGLAPNSFWILKILKTKGTIERPKGMKAISRQGAAHEPIPENQ
jgi:hypothetical protein